MKLRKTLLLVVCALVLCACSNQESDLELDSQAIQTRKPLNLLSAKETASMLFHYDITRKPALEKELGREDTRINYYSIETLENYIKYIKEI